MKNVIARLPAPDQNSILSGDKRIDSVAALMNVYLGACTAYRVFIEANLDIFVQSGSQAKASLDQYPPKFIVEASHRLAWPGTEVSDKDETVLDGKIDISWSAIETDIVFQRDGCEGMVCDMAFRELAVVTEYGEPLLEPCFTSEINNGDWSVHLYPSRFTEAPVHYLDELKTVLGFFGVSEDLEGPQNAENNDPPMTIEFF